MNHQRKQKLNKPKLQLRMVGIFLAISGFAAFGQALLLAQSLMDLSMNIEDPTVAHGVQNAMPGILSTNLMWTTLFLLPFIVMVGLHVTHRIAGPAHRIEGYLRDVAQGADPMKPCLIRANDELQELVTAVNGAFVRLSTNPKPHGAEHVSV